MHRTTVDPPKETVHDAACPLTLSIYAIFVALQVYRLMMEERTPTAAYPTYAEYRTRTARLLPGVFVILATGGSRKAIMPYGPALCIGGLWAMLFR